MSLSEAMSLQQKPMKPAKLKKIKKIKKPKLKQSSTLSTPGTVSEANDKSKKKIKSKSAAPSIIKPKSPSLITSRLKKRKRVSNKENIPTDNNKKSKVIKKKKKSKATSDSVYKQVIKNKNNAKPKPIKQSKRKMKSSNIQNIKERLLSKEQNASLPASAKKMIPRVSRKKAATKNTEVQSLNKKRNKMTRSSSYNVQSSNYMAPRRAISDIYGFGKRKKKKSDGLHIAKAVKIRKKKSAENEMKVHKKKKDKNEKNKAHKAKRRRVPEPSNTEKLPKIRKRVKTKTKKKELYVIGDYVEFGAEKCGVIRYKGYLKNATGIWYGIELIGGDKNGECDGVFNGERYFECTKNAGVFVMYSAFNRKLSSKEIDKILGTGAQKKPKRKAKPVTMSQSLSETLSQQMIAAANESIVKLLTYSI